MVRTRRGKKSHVEGLLEEQRQSGDVSGGKSGRKEVGTPKDKRIGEIIKKVSLWRMLYLGFRASDGEYVEKPLDTAASNVGTAKKTLDDYLLQIRTARNIGFDFNKRKNASIGELREFVKTNK